MRQGTEKCARTRRWPAPLRRLTWPALLATVGALLLGTLASCGLGAGTGGGGPFAGARAAVTSLAINPLAPSRLYLGTRSGLFVSADAGEHWPAAPVAAFGGAGVRAVAPSAVDRDTLWVATGAPLVAPTPNTTATPSPAHVSTATPQATFPADGQTGAAGAVWVSHDAGVTWHWGSSGLPDTVNAIWAGTANANVAWATSTAGGLWVTHDDGLNWSADTLPAHALPRALLGTDTTGASLLLGTSAGLLRTTDGGKRWTPDGDVRGYVYSLVAAPLASHTVYCLTNAGLFRSTDGGAQFAAQSYGLPDTALAVGANPNVLYALAGLNIRRSADGGRTWTLLQSATTAVTGIEVAPPSSMGAPPSTAATGTGSHAAGAATPPAAPADTIFVGLSSPAGVLTSRDGGANWSQQGG